MASKNKSPAVCISIMPYSAERHWGLLPLVRHGVTWPSHTGEKKEGKKKNKIKLLYEVLLFCSQEQAWEALVPQPLLSRQSSHIILDQNHSWA